MRESEEEDKYIPPGFHRLKGGNIVPRKGKKAQAERMDSKSNNKTEKGRDAQGQKRKWVDVPLGDEAEESESPELKRVKRGQ